MANPFDAEDAKTLAYLRSGAAWTVGQSEKDRLFRNHPELPEAPSSTMQGLIGQGATLRNQDIALRNQQMLDDDAAQQNQIMYGRAMGPAPTNPNEETSPQGNEPVIPNYSKDSTNAVQAAVAKAVQASGSAPNQDVWANRPNVPTPPTRPSSGPAAANQGFLSKLFSGNNYQSNNQLVAPKGSKEPSDINWGNGDSSADFFRASQALQKMNPNYVKQNADDTSDNGEKRGGAVKGKSEKHDHLKHALLLISHLLGHKHP
jgi:hypothetical protein